MRQLTGAMRRLPVAAIAGFIAIVGALTPNGAGAQYVSKAAPAGAQKAVVPVIQITPKDLENAYGQIQSELGSSDSIDRNSVADLFQTSISNKANGFTIFYSPKYGILTILISYHNNTKDGWYFIPVDLATHIFLSKDPSEFDKLTRRFVIGPKLKGILQSSSVRSLSQLMDDYRNNVVSDGLYKNEMTYRLMLPYSDRADLVKECGESIFSQFDKIHPIGERGIPRSLIGKFTYAAALKENDIRKLIFVDTVSARFYIIVDVAHGLSGCIVKNPVAIEIF